MVRMQIQFTEAQSERLRETATVRGVSISAVVRDAVDDALTNTPFKPSRDELLKRSLAAMGKYHSGLGDLAARHDAYFAESVDDW